MKNLGFISCFVLGLLITACDSTKKIVNDFTKVKQTLETSQWILQDESGNVKGLDEKEVVLNFRNEAGLTAYGFGGCNSYQSDVILTENSIKFDGIGSTKIYCPSINIEKSFFEMLQQANRYELSGKTLSLYQDNLLLLKLKQQ
ncbi:META domain-containing protein [Vaginella massiliensis]|uniref:META domain-containing protein n=1 Tax=Vaginella massiliensis TaxID=1816680 RepID=UPI000838E2F0|nr:META domain-containing protein [Vaginella massiliensis]